MITINVKSALICVLFIAVIVLVIYLIIIAKNLVKTIKETNKILTDAAVISKIAAEKTVPVSYTHLDVYKRQFLRKVRPLRVSRDLSRGRKP